jgi:nitrate/nitrite transporter NarK
VTPAPGPAKPLHRPAGLPSTRRASVVWGTALLGYVLAVLNRSSFGVAELQAGARFGASASVLASFVGIQLLVYATLQLPVGIVLDRLGPRRLIATGAVLMALGQLTLALVSTTAGALGARALVGAGDAMTFVSVVRLVPAWFPPRRVPLLTQLTGIIGQLGQVIAAIPLVLMLQAWGWGASFGVVAVLGAVAGVAVLALVRDVPQGDRPGPVLAGARRVPSSSGLRATLREPGTWLGYWTHFISQFSGTLIILLWGFPFLVQGQGLTTAQASALFTVNVLAAIVAGPVIGQLTGRHPAWRLRLVAGVAAASVAAWALVLVPSGPRPLWVLTVFMVVVAVGGPTSLVSFDFARSYNPPERLGTATGLVNAGGFVAALATMLGVGLVLDAVGPGAGGAYSLDSYRIALSVVAIPFVAGGAGLAYASRLTRRRSAAAAGGPEPDRPRS